MRMPMRLILSAYAGPMPRPVVPSLALAEEALGDLVDGGVVRRDHVRVGADDQRRQVDAAGDERVELAEQRLRRDHDAVGDHAGRAGREDAAGQQVRRELLAVDDDRVAGVVAAARAHHEVDGLVGGEQVGGLALALVAPLGTEDDDRGHVVSCVGCVDGSKAGSRADATATRASGARSASVRGNGPAARHHQQGRRYGGPGDPRGRAARSCEPDVGRGGGDLRPGRARRRAAAGRLAPDRGGGRRRQPARRDVRAAPPQRARERGRGAAAAGDRQRLRPRRRHPPRHRGGRPAACSTARCGRST